MELRQRMLRQAARTVAARSVEEIRRDPRRGLRNLADLAACWAATPGQRAAVARVQGALGPSSRYYRLAGRVAEQVARPRLEALAQALVTSLGYGARALSQHSRRLGLGLPWCLLLERPLPPASRLLEEAQELGCSIFLLRDWTVQEACAAAQSAPDAFFAAAVRARQLGPGHVRRLAGAYNLAVSVEVEEGWAQPPEAFRLLAQAGCLFGGHRVSGPLNPLQEHALQERLANVGCCFLAYLPGSGQLPGEDWLLAERARGKCSLVPLLPGWDLRQVARAVSPGVPLARISPELPLVAQLKGRALAARRAVLEQSP